MAHFAHFADATIWWLLAGSLIVVELLLGTVVLLLIGAGFAAAALAAHAGVGLAGQLSVAAVVGVGGVVTWHLLRQRRANSLPPEPNNGLSLDIGESVQIDAWNADGSATVRYRGAQWTVVPLAGVAPSPGAHRVTEVVGSRLVVEKI